MWLVYYVSIQTVGTMATDWTNDVLFGEIVPGAIGGLLNAIGVAEGSWLYGLIIDGIVAGVGAVIGFVPQMLVLFFFLPSLKAADTWLVSHSSWTVSSVSSVSPANPSSR
jgi:ferrous iron transport protein B